MLNLPIEFCYLKCSEKCKIYDRVEFAPIWPTEDWLGVRDKLLPHFPTYSLISLQWGAVDAEIKVPSGENTEFKRSPLKPGVGQYIAIHATLTARDFFLPCLFLPFRPIHLHFFQILSRFFLRWLWLKHGTCVGQQNKIGHPAGGRFPCWVPAEYKQAQKHDLWYDDLWNEWIGDRVKFVFSHDVILCGWLGSKHQLSISCSVFRLSAVNRQTPVKTCLSFSFSSKVMIHPH